jgi:hypothetical protein
MNRLRRCRSFTPEQRTAILKQVRRYIADPPKPRTDRKISYKESDRYFEPQSQKQNGAKTEEENVRVQVKQDRLGQNTIQRAGVCSRGKRLTNCTKCNKSG